MNGSRWPRRCCVKRRGQRGHRAGCACNHFFTNLNESGIDWLDHTCRLRPLVRDPLLHWPDSVRVGAGSWLHIAVNQLRKTPAFSGAAGTPGHRPPTPAAPPPFQCLRGRAHESELLNQWKN